MPVMLLYTAGVSNSTEQRYIDKSVADGSHQSRRNLTDDAVVKTDSGTGWVDSNVRGPKKDGRWYY